MTRHLDAQEPQEFDPNDGVVFDDGDAAYDAWKDEDESENLEWTDDDIDHDFSDDDEYDGQPDEYTEWQDLYGGDDWDHGQYDEG